MSKVKAVTTYKASDGKEFNSAEDAQAIDIVALLKLSHSRMPRPL